MSLSKRKTEHESAELCAEKRSKQGKFYKCVVEGCGSESSDFNLFLFPETKKIVNGKAVKCYRSVQRLKQWIKNTGSEGNDTRHVCDRHFTDDSFVGEDRKRLKSRAIPTLFGYELQMVEENKKINVQNPDHTYFIGSSNAEGNFMEVGSDVEQGSEENVVSANKKEYAVNEGATTSNIEAEKMKIYKRDDHTYCKRSGTMNDGNSKRLRQCCMKGCTNKDDEHSFYKFPEVLRKVKGEERMDEKSFKRFKKWVIASGKSDLMLMSPCNVRRKYFVCDDHFEDLDFKNGNHKILKQDVEPKRNINPIISSLLIEEYEKNLKLWRDSSFDASVFFNEQSIGFAFDQEMDSLIWVTCEKCKSKTLESSLKKISKCHYGSACWKYSVLNGMDPGEVPEELEGLTYIEEVLIALIHPIITVFQVKGHQHAYSGNVISFPQNVQELATQLPYSLQELKNVIPIRYENAEGKFYEFQVRREKLRRAIIWLQRNNPYYKHIILNTDNLMDLPEDGSVLDKLNCIDMKVKKTEHDDVNETEEFEDKIHDSGVPDLNVPKQDDCIKNKLKWPSIGNDPVREKETPGLFVCAFPTLFPYGKCDLYEDRIEHMKTFNYIKHLLQYFDGRFAKHLTFRFFAYNYWMRWTAMYDGHVFVKNNKEFENMTVSDLREKIKENEGIMRKIMYNASNLKGTKAYWYSRGLELRDMVEQLGSPTIFLTLSCADGHWRKLYQLLSDKDPEDLTEAERRKLVRDNPHVVDTFFANRVESFINNVMETKYKVVDYWYRVEYQHRGSPHIHGVFWIDGSPDVLKIETASEAEIDCIVQYFSDLIEAWNPIIDPGNSDVHPCRKSFSNVENFEDDLAHLLHHVQRHSKCSVQYCYRLNKKTKLKECRYKFPKEMQDEATLTKNDTGEYEFKPRRNDPKLNKFNKFIIQLWRANMDIAPVISRRALMCYLTKYISKCEIKSESLKSIFDSVANTLDADADVKKAILRLYMKSCAERDISAQEVMHVLLRHKLYSAGGRSFIHVNMSEKKWRQIHDENDEKQCKNILEKYEERPDRLENVSLWNCCKEYNPQTWKNVRKENIVCVYPKILKSENEKYYRQCILLHVPWRIVSDVKSEEETWEDAYTRLHVEELMEKTKKMGTDGDVACEEEEYESEIDTDSDDDLTEECLAARLGSKKLVEQINLGKREVDMNYNWEERYKYYEQYGTMGDIRSFIDNQKKNRLKKDSPVLDSNVLFTDDQKEVIDLIKNQIKQIKKSGNSANLVKRFIIQGKAGTGKSFLINHIRSLLHTKLGPESYILAGPTGISAILISGGTIHSIFKIQYDHHEFKASSGENLRYLSNLLQKAKFLIIDEYSMLGCRMLAMINKRCQQGTGNYDEDFGGLNVLMLGDIKQLPPVDDSAFFSKSPKSELAQQGKLLVDNFQKVFILSTCHRQQKDKQFLQILDRLSDMKCTSEDYKFLTSRFRSNLPFEEVKKFEHAVRLFPHKDEVKAYNNKKMAQLIDEETGNLKPVVKVKAKHNCQEAKVGSVDKAQGLERELYLSHGCQIMLRTNLWIDAKLCNGTIGTIVDILTGPDEETPSVILCEFEDYTGPSLIPNKKIVPIVAILRQWTNGEKISCSRYQFPITLSYACTIHKSQGMTLSKAVIDIADADFATGLTYVALSRVKSINDLLLEPFIKKRLTASAHVKRTIEIRNDFLMKLQNKM